MDDAIALHRSAGKLARFAFLCCLCAFSFDAAPAKSDDRGYMLALINQYRAGQSLGALTPDKRLERAALSHARYLTEIGRLDHEGPNGESLVERLRRAGYDFQRAGENLASGTSDALIVLDLWLESDGHRQTLMDPRFVDAGISLVGVGENSYWVLVLGAPRR